MPFWAFRIKDEFKYTAGLPIVPESTYCTYIRHMKLIDGDFVFAGCNVWRTDLNSVATSPPVYFTTTGNTYKWSPVLMKLKYQTGETVFARYLPVDSFGNTMIQNVLFAEQIGTYDVNGVTPLTTSHNIFAVWRYRLTINTVSKLPQQTFAGIKFDDVAFSS